MSANVAYLSHLKGLEWSEPVKKPFSRLNRRGSKNKSSKEKREGGAGAISEEGALVSDPKYLNSSKHLA